jgi:hypothetical protein
LGFLRLSSPISTFNHVCVKDSASAAVSELVHSFPQEKNGYVFDANLMKKHEVSARVNRADNDDEECAREVAVEQPALLLF